MTDTDRLVETTRAMTNAERQRLAVAIVGRFFCAQASWWVSSFFSS